MKKLHPYMKRIGILMLGLFVLASCSKDDDNGTEKEKEKEEEKSDAKEITAFTFLASDNEGLSEDVKGIIDKGTNTINAAVPFGTDVTALKPTIALSEKATVNPKDKATVDFRKAVVYTVTAEDGSEAKYTVTVTIGKSSAKAIVSFGFLAVDNEGLPADVAGTVDQDGKTITVVLPSRTDVSALVPTVVISESAGIVPESKATVDFGQAVEYTVTALDGSTAVYSVTVTVEKSDAKSITSFKFLAQDNDGLLEDMEAMVDEERRTIVTELPFGVDITALVPTVATSVGAGVVPQSKSSIDFKEAVSYTVTAEDETTIEYTVTVTLRELTEREILLTLYYANPNSPVRWDFEDSISNWNGVDTENDKVVGLDIRNLRMSTIPPEIGNLKNLRELNLLNNGIATIPMEIGDLTNLESLVLTNNDLTSIPSEIGNLSNLEVLSLEANLLTVLPVELGNLANLRQLTLLSNSLIAVPAQLGNLSSLQGLNLSDNPSLSNIPEEIGNLSNLEALGLINTSLTIIPSQLGNLRSLRALALSQNMLTSIPKEIGNLSNLVLLHLHDNNLTELPEELGQLSKLNVLHIQNNQITTIPKEVCDLNITDFEQGTATCEQ